MAEGGNSQQPVFHFNINLFQKGDSMKVQGDNVGNKTEVKAGEIGMLTTNVGSEEIPGQVQAVVGNVQGDATAPSSGEPVIAQLAEMKLTESNLKASMSEARAHILVEKGEYGEAIDLLEEILPMQGCNTLTTLLVMVECYAHLRQRPNFNNLLTTMKEWMSSTNVEHGKIQELAESYQDSHPIRAIILRSCLAGVLKRVTPNVMSPNVAVRKIWNKCSWPICRIIKKFAPEKQKIYKNFALPLIISCLDDLREVTGADGDTKVETEASCLNDIGLSYYYVGEPSKAIEYYEKGMEIMERQFGSNASKYQVLGHLLNNMGLVNEYLGQFKKAEEFYLKSIEAREKATDWPSDAIKKENIETTKNNLRITRDKMKK